jgi:hypothetical protein
MLNPRNTHLESSTRESTIWGAYFKVAPLKIKERATFSATLLPTRRKAAENKKYVEEKTQTLEIHWIFIAQW